MDLDKVKRQDKKGEIWVDHIGRQVYRDYVDDYDQKKEDLVYRAFQEFKRCHDYIKGKKEAIEKIAEKLEKLYMKRYDLTEEQFSFTYMTFDRKIQFEVDSQITQDYDKNLIEQATSHFKNYLENSTEKVNPGLKMLIEDLIFSVNKNRMVSGIVKKLERTANSIEHPEMKEAVKLIGEAKVDGDRKLYYRVRILNEETKKYELLDINFSAL